MTMWNEADIQHYTENADEGIKYLLRFARKRPLPWDNPKSCNHGAYQRAVNRCTFVLLVIITVTAATVMGGWPHLLMGVVALLGVTLVGLACLFLLAVVAPAFCDWLMGE